MAGSPPSPATGILRSRSGTQGLLTLCHQDDVYDPSYAVRMAEAIQAEDGILMGALRQR